MGDGWAGTGGGRVKGLKKGGKKGMCGSRKASVVRRTGPRTLLPPQKHRRERKKKPNKERTPMYGEGAADVGPDAQPAKTSARRSILKEKYSLRSTPNTGKKTTKTFNWTANTTTRVSW